MPKTILITGASSGIGKATARFFAARGWNVVATMRNTADGVGLEADNVLLTRLDLDDLASIQGAVDAARERFGGLDAVVNNAGRMAYPFGALYHGSKWAVEGLSEALHFEARAIGVRVKLVEPGGVKTDFGGRSFVFTNDEGLAEYQPLVRAMLAAMAAGTNASGQQEPDQVAEVIWTAVTDDTDQLRYISGDGAKQLLGTRYAAEQDEAFVAGMRKRAGL